MRLRYVTRDRVCYSVWAVKPTYVYLWTWGLPGRASAYRRLHRRLSRAEAVELLGRDLKIGECVKRY